MKGLSRIFDRPNPSEPAIHSPGNNLLLTLGNAQGKNQQEGVLGPTKRGADRPYILKPLRSGNPIWITIRPVLLGKQPIYQGEANT